MTSFQPMPPKQAVEVVSRAGVSDPQSLIIDFARAGLVKAYALVIETFQDGGKGDYVRGGAIPTELWRRISCQGSDDDVWTGGTIRLPAEPSQSWPEVNITGVSFSEKSLRKLIAHCGAQPPDQPPVVMPGKDEDRPSDSLPLRRERRTDLSAIPTGAVVVTVNQAMAALGLGRTKINELMNDGRLERVKLDGGTRIKVDSILRLVDSDAAGR